MKQASLLSIAVAGALLANCSLHAQTASNGNLQQSDSLISRLIDIKHVGLGVDEKLGGYVLHMYTPAQHTENLASLAAYREKMEEFNARIEPIDEKRREAQQRRAGADELNAITRERNRLQSERPYSQFVRDVILYDVVHVGTDYIEVCRTEDQENTFLIPVSKICKIFAKTGSTRSATDAGEQGDEREPD